MPFSVHYHHNHQHQQKVLVFQCQIWWSHSLPFASIRIKSLHSVQYTHAHSIKLIAWCCTNSLYSEANFDYHCLCHHHQLLLFVFWAILIMKTQRWKVETGLAICVCVCVCAMLTILPTGWLTSWQAVRW